MSAFPFGGHPTFSSYLTWAAQTAGCKVQTAYSKSGKSKLSMTCITAPSGKHVIVTGTKQNERLAPKTVAYLDRRLGLKSPFPYP